VPAVRAVRSRSCEVVTRLRLDWQAQELARLRLPVALQHARQAVDHHVEETAHHRTDEQRREELHAERQPGHGAHMVWAILKMGRYMATTMPPMTTPRKTMMIGSSSWESEATASSTSRS